MHVAERFIRRPVVTILVMLGILLLGVTSYLFLARSRAAKPGFPNYLGLDQSSRR